MKKQIEVEGGELAIRNSHGDIVIIPKKNRIEVEGMIKDKCWSCVDAFVDTLPVMADYAEDGSLIIDWGKIKSKLNPYNWGVDDYTDKGDFNSAYFSAKKEGKKEFMWNNKRYNVYYAGTPRQEVGKYGINNKEINPLEINHPVQVNKYDPLKKYVPGHIEAQLTDYSENNPSVNYSPKGNYPLGINTIKEAGKKTYNVYGDVDKQKFENKAYSLPTGKYSILLGLKEEPSDWNLFTNNCADNVCDAFNIPRAKGLETPNNTLKKIIEKYPTIEVTGRTYDDYLKLSKDIQDKNSKDVLKNSKNLIGLRYSPDLINTKVDKNIISKIQKSLVEEGYKLPKSTKKDASFDGIFGNETKQALLDWQNKNKTK
jgi:hypothetical protein